MNRHSYHFDTYNVEIERAVEEACRNMLERTGGKGFPILMDDDVSLSNVVAAVQRVVGPSTLLYTCKNGRQKEEATEAEVEEWVRRWKRGEETRVLLTDTSTSKGWEARCLVAIGCHSPENLVMRACAFCILIQVIQLD